jgi:hypothetical protein
VCSLLVYEPDLVDACTSLVREDEERVAAGAPSAIARAAAYWRAAAARAVAAALADLAAAAEAAPMQLPMQLPMLAPAHLLAQVPVAGLNDGMPVALATPYVGVPDGTPVAEATPLPPKTMLPLIITFTRLPAWCCCCSTAPLSRCQRRPGWPPTRPARLHVGRRAGRPT